MKRISLELPEELAAQIDRERGDVPRNRWIRRAIEAALGGYTLDRLSVSEPDENAR